MYHIIAILAVIIVLFTIISTYQENTLENMTEARAIDLERELAIAQQKKKELENQLTEIKNNLENCQEEKRDLNEEKQKLDARYEVASNALDEKIREIKTLDNKLYSCQGKIMRYEGELRNLKKTADEKDTRFYRLEGDYNRLKANMEN